MKFEYNDPAANEPIRIEQVFAEKPAGGLVKGDYAVIATTAVYEGETGVFVPVKCARLYAANASSDTSLKVEKGCGFVANEFVAFGTKAVKVTAVDTSDADFDVLTVTMGVDIPANAALYQAKAASASAAEPVGVPVYVTGHNLRAGEGNQPVRLINGANLRKETCMVAPEVAKLMSGIHLV